MLPTLITYPNSQHNRRPVLQFREQPTGDEMRTLLRAGWRPRGALVRSWSHPTEDSPPVGIGFVRAVQVTSCKLRDLFDD
jgi:hypothetical protein